MNEFIHPIAILPFILSIMGTGALIILAVANLRHKPATVKINRKK
jgi:hypothetical protein